jgi:predicted CXXCH cytochrome family protein
VAILIVVGLAAVVGYFIDPGPEGDPEPSGGFVGSQACRDCHEKEYFAWVGSHHDRAMEEPAPDSVEGDFLDARFSHHGVETRFSERDGAYFITTEGPDGKPREYPVRYTFGVFPLQQYILDMGDGRMQALTVSWDAERTRWYSIYDEHIPPGDALHWTGPQFNWNHMCAECHTTDYRKNYDAATDSYRSSWKEIDVSCEACHGPGREHVDWAGQTVRDEDPRMAVRLRGRGGSSELDVCARCHSRRSRLTPGDDISEPYLDHYDPALLTEPLYHADGQIRDEVFVWGSFLQSKMHRAGVLCTDCHDPHTAGLKREGNALCTHCHQLEPPVEFPTLKKLEYDDVAHHGHTPGHEGGACVECHMPATTYMGIDARRDHSFRVPRPDLTIEIDTPNACTDCHADRPAEWAAASSMTMGEGKAMESPHFATAFAAARRSDPRSVPNLIRILHGEAAPGIVRATAARELGRFPAIPVIEALTDALDDKEPLVRAAAASALGQLPRPTGEVDAALKRMLDDPIRLVRVNAATSWRGERTPAHDEVAARNRMLADRAEGPYNDALDRERARDTAGAEAAYRRAIERDGNFVPARFNYGNLLARLGRMGEAEEQFRAVLRSSPENGEAYYSLGLLLAESGRLPDSAAALRQAARLMPKRARVHYNLGLALGGIGRPGEARAALEAAHALDRSNSDFVNALIAHHAQQKEWDAAIRYAKALVALLPDDPRAKQLLRAVQKRGQG